MRFGYNPSDITGIQDESQNQTLGQNDFSRTGIQTLRDTTFVAKLDSTLSNTMVNEARFNSATPRDFRFAEFRARRYRSPARPSSARIRSRPSIARRRASRLPTT